MGATAARGFPRWRCIYSVLAAETVAAGDKRGSSDGRTFGVLLKIVITICSYHMLIYKLKYIVTI